jgi:RNA polymerase sigma factor (sigma-70 family)
MSINLEEVNSIARTFLELKKKAAGGCEDAQRKYKVYQNYCAQKLSPLVKNKTSKYKKFSNYPDLQQDGFEALMLAFETYDPNKGDFIWWASKYINTRVCRAANAHSTIRFPLKKAKDIQPYKTNTMPILVDSKRGPLESVEEAQRRAVIQEAIAQLPEKQRKIILLHYEFKNGNSSISKISKELKISRPACVKLLEEAEKSLKIQLQNHFG